ncbi:hypothetical protein MCUN1_002544 [Malassezia cuniculi]|uniref:Uncharacterized protein n=1 Tax=Malassezia cuniculi TaxID=948313 RepID=A0AAF0J6Y5_9BASI|nr:hypothetical protein MCUN1_002544 [Malassezia cuniculi]
MYSVTQNTTSPYGSPAYSSVSQQFTLNTTLGGHGPVSSVYNSSVPLTTTSTASRDGPGSSYPSYDALKSSESTESTPTSRPHRTFSTTQHYYTFVQTTSFVMPTTDSAQGTTTVATTTWPADGNESTNYPKSILPEGGNSTMPNDCFEFAVLFRDTLPWSWLVTQRNTTAQIFTYLPRVLAMALDIEHEAITTKRLEKYTNSSTQVPLALFVAYAPNSTAEALRAAVMKTSSPLYKKRVPRVAEELINQINTSYDPLWYHGKPDTPSTNFEQSRQQAIAGGVGGVGGAAVLGLLFYLLQRYNHRRRIMQEKEMLQRRGTIHSFSGLAPDQDSDFDASSQVIGIQLGSAASHSQSSESVPHIPVGNALHTVQSIDSSLHSVRSEQSIQTNLSSSNWPNSANSRYPQQHPDFMFPGSTAPVTKVLGKAL